MWALTSNLRIILSLAAACVTVFIFWSQFKGALQRLQYGIIWLTMTTAAIHLLSGANDYWLYFNGVGYLIMLIPLYFLPFEPVVKLRPLFYWLLIGYTALTIVLYFVIHPWGIHGDTPDILGWLTKIVEGLLVILLLVDLRQTGSAQIFGLLVTPKLCK